MPKISKAFFYLTELPPRWGRSLSEITGWALAGRLHLMVPITPVKCGAELVSGIVRVPAEDVARLFRPSNEPLAFCQIMRVQPTDALQPIHVTEPKDGVEIRLCDLMLDAEEVSAFERVNDLLGIGQHKPIGGTGGKGGPGRPPAYEWELMLTDIMIDLAQNGLPQRQDDLVKLMLDWFSEHSADGTIPEISTVRKRYAPIWWHLQNRL